MSKKQSYKAWTIMATRLTGVKSYIGEDGGSCQLSDARIYLNRSEAMEDCFRELGEKVVRVTVIPRQIRLVKSS